MAEWSGGSIQWCLLLLLLLPTLLLAQDDCSHNCKNEANRYYFVKPEGSAETLCPAQPCLTPSQLRQHFSECERNHSCQTANTSLVLLPGTYTSASNHESIIPELDFLSLTEYNEDCDTDPLATPSIDCNGTWISLHIKCLHVQNCVVFTGNDTNVKVGRVTFHDSLIRLSSITTADHSELDYNYTLGSQSYCLVQKQLADINTSVPSSSVLALRNISFSSDYHTACAREYGIQLATIHGTESDLDIVDCLLTQNAVTHISLLHSTLHTSGIVRFENANTAIMVKYSAIALTGEVTFLNTNNSAILALDSHSNILLAGTVEFTNNTANNGGAISMMHGNLTIADNAHVVLKGNHAKTIGGAIASLRHVTIAGSAQFINNSASQGGAIDSDVNVTIADNAQVVFQSNHAKTYGGAISSHQHVTIAGSVQFINNSADQGGAIDSDVNVTTADNAKVLFQGNHAKTIGGAIISLEHVTIAGSVQFINNSADQGGAIDSDGNVTIADNAQVIIQGNHAKTYGGVITSGGHVTIAGSVQFINNSARHGGAISSINVTTADNTHVVFQANHADGEGGAIFSSNIVLAGSVQFVSNTAQLGGAISVSMIPGHMKVANNAQVVFQGNHAYRVGGAVYSMGSAFGYQLVIAAPCLISFGVNSTMDLLHNTAEPGGMAMYGIRMSQLVCETRSDVNYKYLFDIIIIIPDSFSAVSSDPLRVCICSDQSTPDCLAILPDQNIQNFHYTIYPGQNFTIPAAVVGFNFALTSGSVYAQTLSSDASLGSESQYVQGVNQTGCT